jgi:hypothetical protein
MQIGRNDGVESLRMHRHTLNHGIQLHHIHFNFNIFFGNLGKYGIPFRELANRFKYNPLFGLTKHHSPPLHVAVCDHCQLLAWSRLGCFKGKAEDALCCMSSKDSDFCCYSKSRVGMSDTSLSRVFSFAVLSNDDPIHGCTVNATKRRQDAP